ncbi:MAG: hypothetical protein J4G10_02680 [Alphaproteobacteria bacterium]|nr:hypothetical protein [Alphaproteobacteria bacterium]
MSNPSKILLFLLGIGILILGIYSLARISYIYDLLCLWTMGKIVCPPLIPWVLPLVVCVFLAALAVPVFIGWYIRENRK